MKKFLASILCLLTLGTTTITPAIAVNSGPLNLININKADDNIINIAILIDGDNESYDNLIETYKREISNYIKPEYQANFIKVEHDDWTLADLKKKANALLNNKSVDVVVGLGFLATNYLSNVSTDKIVVKVFDYGTTAESVYNSKANLPKQDIEMLYSQMKFKKLGIFVNEEYLREMPALKTALEAMKNDRFSIEAIPVGSKTTDYRTIIPSDIDTAYITPLYNLSREQVKNLYVALNEKKIVSFSTQGQEAIEDGAFAALEIPNRQKRLARQTAQNILIALNNKDKNDGIVLPVASKDAQVLISSKTAKSIGACPDWNVVLNAKVVEDVNKGNIYTLSSTLNRVVNDNPELKEKMYALAAAKDDKYAAISKYLPSVGFDLMNVNIDEDRAETSLGMAPKQASSFGLSVRQVLFSDKLNTNLTVKNKLAKLSAESARQAELNLQIHAAVEYVDYLRNLKLQKVQEDQINNTKADMTIVAENGSKNLSDNEKLLAYLALARVNMLQYRNDLRIGRIYLNKYMYREQNQSFELKDLNNDSPELFTSQFEINKYLDTPSKLAVFEEELVKRALIISPELKQLDNAIGAKKREMAHYAVNPILPDVVFDLQARNNYDRDFVGNTVVPNPAGTVAGQKTPMYYPASDSLLMGSKKAYQAVFLARWELFNGGEDQMKLLKAKNEVKALESKRAVISQEIEQEVRTKVNKALTGYFKAKYAALSVADAQKSFEDAQKKYKAGKLEITDLLYVQDRLLELQKEAINSKADFLIGLLWVQRGIGCVDFSNTNADHQQWFKNTIQKMDATL